MVKNFIRKNSTPSFTAEMGVLKALRMVRDNHLQKLTVLADSLSTVLAL